MKLLRFQLNKLIRDNMSQDMRNQDIIVHDKILDDKEYIAALKAKLEEEVAEALCAQSLDEYKKECADVLEVVHAFIKALGSSIEEVEAIRLAKKERSGGFDAKIYAMYVEHTQEHPATAYCRSQPHKYPEITPPE